MKPTPEEIEMLRKQKKDEALRLKEYEEKMSKLVYPLKQNKKIVVGNLYLYQVKDQTYLFDICMIVSEPETTTIAIPTCMALNMTKNIMVRLYCNDIIEM